MPTPAQRPPRMFAPGLSRLTFAADAPVLSPAGTLGGTVVPFGQTITRMGVPLTFAAGSLELPGDLSTVKLLVQHDDDRPVGYATAAAETAAGLDMLFELPEHPRSVEASSEVALKLRDGFSVGVAYTEETMDQIFEALFGDPPEQPITVHGTLREVSVVSIPAFNDARASATAAAAALGQFSVTPAPAIPAQAPPPADPPPPDQLNVHAGEVRADFTLDELAARVAPLVHAAPAGPGHPLSRFASFAEYAAAAYADPELARFALVDQITPDNPGVMPPTWLSDVKGIIDRARPGIEAVGGPSSAGDSGLDINWPYFDGDLTTMVGQQLTEKAEITSVKVSLKRGTASLKTYAGGSDISYQLLTRSSPSYRDAYMRIMNIAYGITTDNVFVDALTAAATTGPVWDPAAGTADQLRGALFASSAAVQVATGSPASVVLAATDMFVKLGGLPGLWPATYGTQNVSGTADAATLQISVAGLRVVLDANLAPGTLLVTNSLAATWAEAGPFVATAEDVNKLGQNTAIWGLGATATFLPKGIVKLPAV